MDMNDLLKHIPSIRRPISLVALIVIVLYGVYKLVLELPIFEGIGGERTFQLIDRIVFYLFVLAMASVILILSKPILMALITKSDKDGESPKITALEQTHPKTSQNDEMKLEEYVLLLDEIVIEVKDLEYIGNTFGAMRRKLSLIMKLAKKAKGHLLKILSDYKLPNGNSLSTFVNDTLQSFISEADFTLPYPNEDKYTRDRELLKKDKYQVISQWDSIKDQLFKDSVLESQFNQLKADERHKWSIIGFENSEAYSEYISPSFSTLCNTATPIQKKFLAAIRDSTQITEQQLMNQGFPKEVVVETLNPLLKSKLITTDDWESFTVTPVGKEMISDYLNQA